jgi:cbb3-type cytochrome oxidase maturation protein
MNILLLLAPFSVFLGLLAVAAFVWTLRAGQYDDIRGAAERILLNDDDEPTPDRPDPDRRGPDATAPDDPPRS